MRPLRLGEMRAARATMAGGPDDQSRRRLGDDVPTIVRYAADVSPPDRPEVGAREHWMPIAGPETAEEVDYSTLAYACKRLLKRVERPDRAARTTPRHPGAPAPAARTRPARSGPATWSLAPPVKLTVKQPREPLGTAVDQVDIEPREPRPARAGRRWYRRR